jgi:hypothetical protein
VILARHMVGVCVGCCLVWKDGRDGGVVELSYWWMRS